MSLRLKKGQIAILVMFAAVAIYTAALMLITEPTPWRDIPDEGMSRKGLAYSDEIAEMKLSYMPRRSFPFYFADERAHYEPLARVGDAATIRQILDMLKPAKTPGQPGCLPAKRDAMLHVITYRTDGSVFGYVVLQAGRVTAEGPRDARDCTIGWQHKGDEFVSWEIYDARARLTELTGVSM